MSECTNPYYGEMIHAFELNQLELEQRDAFEVHLLECDFCFKEAQGFAAVASLLRGDGDVREMVGAAASEAPSTTRETPDVSWWSRLKDYLWPQAPLHMRPALLYLLIVALAYPAYLGLQGPPERGPQGIQSIMLTGTRSVAKPARTGEPLVVMFRIDGARAGKAYRVVVKSADDTVVYENDRFEDFNDREMGSLLLDAGTYSPGSYTIEVYDSGRTTPMRSYTFSAE